MIANDNIDRAISLLNELHRERLSYDEYAILYDVISDLKSRKCRTENEYVGHIGGG